VEEEVKETKPVTKPVEQAPKEEPKVEEKKVDSNALYPGSSSQGNKENTAGDAGNPDGNVEARALYGKQGGGGGGPSLDLAGWRWDFVPNPNDNSKENGRIVFEIRVDDNGEVIGVRTLEKTVSPAVEQLYRREVEKLTFSPTSNSIPAPISTGKITFIIRSK
jgi:protein TonB